MMTAFTKMGQREREALMRVLAEAVSNVLGKTASCRVHFTLIVWPEKDGALSNYISNADRSCMIKALRETADRLETRQDMQPVVGGIQ